MAVALTAHDGMNVQVHHDERAAGFMALGIGIATGHPAVVLTTSGTAAVELHPAIVEAHHAAVPMIAVTADRPPELQRVGAPQTIDQRELFGGAVRWFVDPGPPQDQFREGWRQLGADVVYAARRGIPGPVHLNLAFREPLLGEPGDLPAAAMSPEPEMPRFGLLDEQLGSLAPMVVACRGVIVAGSRTVVADDRCADDLAAVLELAQRTGWPVLADHLSGARVDHERVVSAFDPMLRDARVATTLRPDVVIRIGGLLASRVTNEWLAASGAEQIAIDRWGVCPDPDHVVGTSFPVDVGEACRQLASLPRLAAAPDDWTDRWRAAEVAARAAIDDTISGEPAVAGAVAASVGAGGALVVSSSMPVRDLEWFTAACPDVRVVSNRGANGIDGVVSTAVGIACTGMPTVCLVGDVAFLHDTNAMVGLARRGLDLAVVVIDNDGGGIFSFLAQAEALPLDRFELLFGTPHGADLVGLARAHGLDASRVVDAAAVAEALTTWRRSGGAAVIVVDSDRDANVEVHRRINDAVAAAVSNADGFRGE